MDALLGSELYQQRRGGRGALDDDRVAALLTVLMQGGGRATYEPLAAKSAIPAFRIAGTVTALRRLLQVEGYPVIEIDPDGTTVLLNATLLAQQFDLDVPASDVFRNDSRSAWAYPGRSVCGWGRLTGPLRHPMGRLQHRSRRYRPPRAGPPEGVV